MTINTRRGSKVCRAPARRGEQDLSVQLNVEFCSEADALYRSSFGQPNDALEIIGAVYKPEELEILGRTFDKCWSFLQSEPNLYGSDVATRQRLLARCLLLLGHSEGYDDPVSLAENAMSQVRATLASDRAVPVAEKRLSHRG